MNARWGMSPAEVEKANTAPFKEAQSSPKLFTPKETVKDPSRYRVFQSEISFLGRPAAINYVFFDGKFYTYHIFVNDSDFDGLDGDMRRYLISRFGVGYSEIQDKTSSLKLVWHTREKIVNYWIYEDEYRLRLPMTAVMGVVYRPIEESI